MARNSRYRDTEYQEYGENEAPVRGSRQSGSVRYADDRYDGSYDDRYDDGQYDGEYESEGYYDDSYEDGGYDDRYDDGNDTYSEESYDDYGSSYAQPAGGNYGDGPGRNADRRPCPGTGGSQRHRGTDPAGKKSR